MVENTNKGVRRVWSRDLHNLVSGIKDGTFKYEDKPKKSIDWRSYNEAQLNELADMLQMIKESVDIAVERIKSREQHIKTNGPGRPSIPNGDIVKVLLLQTYFGCSDRIAGGLLKVFDSKLGISSAFSYKTIERGYDPERTKEILDEVFKLTNEWSNFNEDTAGIDGTGDPTTSKVNYESKRAEQRKEKRDIEGITTAWPSKKHDFQYSVLSSGVHTKIISGFATTDDHHIGELILAYSIMNQTSKNIPKLGIIVGDSLYGCRPFCQIVHDNNASLYAMLKSNLTLRNKGVPDWSRMLSEFILDPQGYLSIVHDRSISETVNSMMKRREPIPIRKRLGRRKNTAEFLKVNVHNLRQSCYLTYLAPALTKLPLRAGG